MTPRRDSPLGTDGFTLIEVLVALVILSAGLLVFYEFLSGALDAAGRVRHAAEAYDRDQNALALAATLNISRWRCIGWFSTSLMTASLLPYRLRSSAIIAKPCRANPLTIPLIDR